MKYSEFIKQEYENKIQRKNSKNSYFLFLNFIVEILSTKKLTQKERLKIYKIYKKLIMNKLI